jgi:hypothetical protein
MFVFFSSYQFHQNNNLLYLTGFEEANSCFVIEKGNGKGFEESDEEVKLLMFLEENDSESEIWTGPKCGISGFKKLNVGIQLTCITDYHMIFLYQALTASTYLSTPCVTLAASSAP